MDERLEFIARIEGGQSVAATCREFGISRPTGYKWIHRYAEHGAQGLADRSRAPRRHPNETPADVVEFVLSARAQHPTWGPRKLLAWLEPIHPGLQLPAASTVATMLKRHGLVVPRRPRRRPCPTGTAPVAQAGPNAVWGTDFKGEFRTRDSAWCYPLTLQDVCSRYLLRCRGLRTCSGNLSKPIFESAFREFGLPVAILSDNGSPFASSSFSGLTPLSVWWVQLGIEVLRIEPGHPEQNGRLERMHRTLKRETTRPPQDNLRAQQRRFDSFRREYNEERPHEALGQLPPTTAYEPSPRDYNEKIREPEYPGEFDVRRVNTNGEMHFRAYRFTIGKALRFEHIGFEEFDEGRWRIHYRTLELGVFDERTGTVSRPGYSMKAASTRTKPRS